MTNAVSSITEMKPRRSGSIPRNFAIHCLGEIDHKLYRAATVLEPREAGLHPLAVEGRNKFNVTF
jgi:hypothetical protein